jgi:phosphate/phosphite/phosphonate ABC transporter binding protein
LSSEKDPPPVLERRPDCPPALAELAHRAIALHPAQRIIQAGLLAEALDEAYPGEPHGRERHRSYLAALYAEPDFVSRHGELPSESGMPSDFKPVFQDEETEQVTVRGLRTLAPLRFGLSPAHGSERARRHGERLGSELSRKLGRKLRTVVLADYESLTEALLAGDLDLAWMPPLPLVTALDGGAGVLAVARRQGASVYHGVLAVHAESPLERMEDLAGRSIGCVDRQSASGFVIPLAALAQALGAESVRSLVLHFHGSHRAVCEAVANRWDDAGATFALAVADGEVASASWQELVPARAHELRPLWLSSPIPSDCVAHRPYLPDRVAGELGLALCALAEEETGAALLRDVFSAESMVPGDPAEYESVRQARDALRALL